MNTSCNITSAEWVDGGDVWASGDSWPYHGALDHIMDWATGVDIESSLVSHAIMILLGFIGSAVAFHSLTAGLAKSHL